MPTKFIFTPTETTAEAKMRLSKLPEWNVPDKKDPALKRYEAFVFELACAELCGKGHYSMRMEVEIVTPEEYVQWLDEQEKNSYYLLNVRGKDFDPYKDKIVPLEEIMAEKDKVNKFVADLDAKIIDLDEKVTEVFTNAAIELAALQDTARTTPDIEIAKENAIKAAAVFNAAMNIKSVDQPLDSVITDNPVDTTLSKEVSSVISSDSGQLSKNE
jgi:cytochrome c oxidase subunit 2